MKLERTQGIVLRRTNYGEADRIVQLITPLGRRSVMARGVRREKSKLAGGIELFAVSDVVIGEGKGELGVLTSARLVQFYRHIMEEYDRMQFGYEAIKLVARASELVDEPEWFDTLHETLAALDVKSVNILLTQTWFYVRYSELLGYGLGLRYDASGQPLDAEKAYRYDMGEKAFVQSDTGDVTSEHIKLLRLVATKSLATLAQVGGLANVLPVCFAVAREHVAVEV